MLLPHIPNIFFRNRSPVEQSDAGMVITKTTVQKSSQALIPAINGSSGSAHITWRRFAQPGYGGGDLRHSEPVNVATYFLVAG